MMWKKLSLLFLLVVLALSCGEDGGGGEPEPCPLGSLSCACVSGFPASTCNPGLACVSGRCIDPLVPPNLDMDPNNTPDMDPNNPPDMDPNNTPDMDLNNPPGFSLIPAGTFTKGSPSAEPGRFSGETQRVVTLTRAFFLQETEVTQTQWQGLMGNNPSVFTTAPAGNRPVETVSWWDAIAYTNALSSAEGLDQCYVLSGCTGTPGVSLSSSDLRGYSCASITFEGLDCEGYRLPTEAEWEYAARAGTTGMTYAGNHAGGFDCNANAILSGIAWWCANSSSTTHNVGEKTANAWGLYDMIGNVGEWTWDWYLVCPFHGTVLDPLSGECVNELGSSDAVTDPTGPATGSSRVFRGCVWGDSAGLCRLANRSSAAPSVRPEIIGFRPARSIP